MSSKQRPFIVFLTASAFFGITPKAGAIPAAPRLFCEQYPEAPDCAGQQPPCTTCHVSTWPASWNSYGAGVLSGLGTGSFEESLPAALLALETLDSDGDGASNALEIAAGSNPGDASETWLYCPPQLPSSGVAPVPVGYDFDVALRRVSILYCGRSPTYEEYEVFHQGTADESVLYDRLHDTLRSCLDSEFWRDRALPRLADEKIRPVASVGADSMDYLGSTSIIIGDYEWDYRLWSYVLTQDRDARELLTADYHVVRATDGSGTLIRAEGEQAGAGALGQALAPSHRAGMITTTWFMAINTMFTPLPRTTAAQAYRAYLGLDIAHQQGLWPVAGEPLDIDNKGVDEPACAVCHTTLEALSYPFAFYQGINGDNTGTFSPVRPSIAIPDWSDQSGTLFGEPLPVRMQDGVATNNLRDWAAIAIETDFFKRNLASVFYRHALGRDPSIEEHPEFEAIWRALPGDGYSANLLIGRIVDTAAFGGAE